MYEYSSVEILEPSHQLKQSRDNKNKNKGSKQPNYFIHIDQDQG